ncbi:MAG TPA: hypothetical protein VE178_03590 [Silvibacterium sp.]|nr:hypothetical protein [Silvibacterium sp.]
MIWKNAGLVLLLVFQLWLAHALAFLVHEYAHSFVAWGLRCKANPLALNYGGLNWNNVIYLDDVDENVDYTPIFAAGHGARAALIAVSGVLFGNGLFYLVSRRLYFAAKARGRRMAAFFMFLLCMMNAGNFISYVPNRTFTNHADMATVERGLNISPWWIAVVMGVPFSVAVWHFFARLLPDAMRFFSPDSRWGQVSLLVLSAYVICRFFGGSGFHRYGDISHWIAAVWLYAIFPLAILLCWPRRSNPAAA